MNREPSLGNVLFEQYLRLPYDLFDKRWLQLDYAGRKAMLEAAHTPGLAPTLQLPYPDTILALRELADRRRANIPTDLRADLEEISEFRRRFELDLPLTTEPGETTLRKPFAPPPAPELPVGSGPKGTITADEQQKEELREARRAEQREETRLVRVDKPERPRGPKQKPVVYADPLVQKSGIQFLTGTQLDVLF